MNKKKETKVATEQKQRLVGKHSLQNSDIKGGIDKTKTATFTNIIKQNLNSTYYSIIYRFVSRHL